MRALTLTALAAGLLVTATAASPARAQDLPYCVSGGWTVDGLCNFYTREQCQAFVQGVGGSCVPNPLATLPQNLRGMPQQRR